MDSKRKVQLSRQNGAYWSHPSCPVAATPLGQNHARQTLRTQLGHSNALTLGASFADANGLDVMAPANARTAICGSPAD